MQKIIFDILQCIKLVFNSIILVQMYQEDKILVILE